MVTASALLFRTPGTTATSDDLTGDLAGPRDLRDPSVLNLPTPKPGATKPPRSSATITVPDGEERAADFQSGLPPLPSLANYVYSVDGTESTGAFGTQRMPLEMAMTVHRPQGDPDIGDLGDGDVVFDLSFSADHTEREVVKYGRESLAFSYEKIASTVGFNTHESEVTYSPAMMQIPIPLELGEELGGTSRVVDRSGTQVRVEDYSVVVESQERLQIMGQDIDTWIVRIQRQSAPGSGGQSITKTRRYWLQPERSIWVKWEEQSTFRMGSGLGAQTYSTNYTATLARIEPL